MKKKIFLVDDDQDCLNALSAILQVLGFDTSPHSDPEAALESLKKADADGTAEKIDIFFLDVMMPKLGGYDLLEGIRALDSYSDTPVFMVTARDTDADTLEGYSKGADYYITKPFTAKQIDYGIKLFFGEK